jgi:cytoskeletal protein CcmA (bactofilin family)
MQIGGTGLMIKGELTADEDLTIDGSFEGSIDIPGHHLVTGASSNVSASVTAHVVTVRGRLEGHINAERVGISPTALVDASVVTDHLALEDGATFNGAVNTDRARAAGDIVRHRRKAP